MNPVIEYYNSSIGKEQIVALSGLILITFVIGHLAGNLTIYGGPDAFNHYAKKLAGFRPFLNYVEASLAIIFIIHLLTTFLLVLQNWQARGTNRYENPNASPTRSLATRLMPYSGIIVFSFVIWHLLDFTFANHQGPRSVLSDGQSYGLYGVVVNSFLDPLHSIIYLIAMVAVGMHLIHGVSSVVQTFGFYHPFYTPIIKRISTAFGLIVTFGYSSIPLYVLIFLK